MKNLSVLTAAIAIVLFGNIHFARAVQFDTAVLQGLDKVTARVFKFNASIGAIMRFGTLEIMLLQQQHAQPSLQFYQDVPHSEVLLWICHSSLLFLFRRRSLVHQQFGQNQIFHQ